MSGTPLPRSDRLPTDDCANCGAKPGGNYCSQCGQGARTKRLASGTLIADFIEEIAKLDSAMLRTAYGLSVRPGRMMREYIGGRRITYKSPLRFYLVVVILNAGIATLLDPISDTRPIWKTILIQLLIPIVFLLVLFPCAVGHKILDAVRLGAKRGQQKFTLAEHYSYILYVAGYCLLLFIILRIVWFSFSISVEGIDLHYVAVACVACLFLRAGYGFYEEPIWRTALRHGIGFSVAFGVLAAVIAIVPP